MRGIKENTKNIKMVKQKETSIKIIGKRCRLIGILSMILGAVLLFSMLRFNVIYNFNFNIFLLGAIMIFLGIFLFIVGRDIEKIE